MDGEFRTEFVRESSALKQHPALVLNADYRPLSYYPLSLWCWQDAVKAAYMDRVDIVAEYDHYGHKAQEMILTDVGDTIHADSLALFALNIEILLAEVTKPEKSKILTLT